MQIKSLPCCCAKSTRKHWFAADTQVGCSGEGVANAGPVGERAFLAGGDRDHELAPAGVAQGGDALLQFLLGRGEGRAADQFRGHEAPLLRLYEDKVAAVVEQIARIGRL